jgi:hypothetical protein
MGLVHLHFFMTAIRVTLRQFSQEHEVLIRDYCERHDINMDDFPTRLKGLL